jgi:hypothetical protein
MAEQDHTTSSKNGQQADELSAEQGWGREKESLLLLSFTSNEATETFQLSLRIGLHGG